MLDIDQEAVISDSLNTLQQRGDEMLKRLNIPNPKRPVPEVVDSDPVLRRIKRPRRNAWLLLTCNYYTVG